MQELEFAAFVIMWGAIRSSHTSYHVGDIRLVMI